MNSKDFEIARARFKEDSDKTLELSSLVDSFISSHKSLFEELSTRLEASITVRLSILIGNNRYLELACLLDPQLRMDIAVVVADIAKISYYLGYTRRAEDSLISGTK